MPLTSQIKFVIAPLLTIIFFQNGISQKLNEIYLIEHKSLQSDSLTNSSLDASNIVLPIVLKSFQAAIRSTENIISWTTLSEQNVKEFVIERTTNSNKEWKTIATISNDYNKKEGSSHTIYDLNPECLSYYRLRSIDFDGKEIVSKTISIQRKCINSPNINTYPNPTQASLNINFEAAQAGVVMMSFTDMLGRVILQKKSDATEGKNNISIDLSGLRSGLYIITFTDSKNNITSQRIEKN